MSSNVRGETAGELSNRISTVGAGMIARSADSKRKPAKLCATQLYTPTSDWLKLEKCRCPFGRTERPGIEELERGTDRPVLYQERRGTGSPGGGEQGTDNVSVGKTSLEVGERGKLSSIPENDR